MLEYPQFEASPPPVSFSILPFFTLLFTLQEDEELQQEFDELMRSGTTMKVSLTPDRLRTFDVCNRKKAHEHPFGVAHITYYEI